jgi:UDP-3-O-[3-hydroxymyristoyl] glucosamine N-acyltransferase LpxD
MTVTLSTAVEFLRSEGFVEAITGAFGDLGDTALSGFASDGTARDGQISWVSAKVLQADRQRPSRFAGTLLIVPAIAGAVPCEASAQSVHVLTTSPKLAICRLAEVFFPESVRTQWPSIADGAVAPGADVHPSAVLAHGVVIAADVRIGAGCEIGPNSCIANADLADGVSIGANCSIGLSGFGYEQGPDGRWHPFPHVGRVRFETGVRVGSNTCIDRGALGDTVVRSSARIDNLVHVAHNVDIGEDAVVIAHAMLGGSVAVGARAWVAPSACVKNQLLIGEGAVIGLGAVVIKDVPKDTTVIGNPAKVLVRSTGL